MEIDNKYDINKMAKAMNFDGLILNPSQAAVEKYEELEVSEQGEAEYTFEANTNSSPEQQDQTYHKENKQEPEPDKIAQAVKAAALATAGQVIKENIAKQPAVLDGSEIQYNMTEDPAQIKVPVERLQQVKKYDIEVNADGIIHVEPNRQDKNHVWEMALKNDNGKIRGCVAIDGDWITDVAYLKQEYGSIFKQVNDVMAFAKGEKTLKKDQDIWVL